MSLVKDVVVEDLEDIATAGLRRGIKQKGAIHNLYQDSFDNPELQVADGWEFVGPEYWTITDCERYVQMYHIKKT